MSLSLIQGAFFVFFLGSGFCGLLYEIVWARLAMADFGVTTAVVSVVLSVFMAGLALGSWLAGGRRLLAWIGGGRRFLRGYALVELGIGTGAFLVPLLFDRGRWLCCTAASPIRGATSCCRRCSSRWPCSRSPRSWARRTRSPWERCAR